jgi:hemoglobin
MIEDKIADLVERFYAKVRRDDYVGGVFESAVIDWPEHLDRLTDFWSSVMLGTGRYKGNPMAVHHRHRDLIRPDMFDRWLALWRETAAETMPPAEAAAFVEKAERIAESLKLGLFFRIEDGARPALG